MRLQNQNHRDRFRINSRLFCQEMFVAMPIKMLTKEQIEAKSYFGNSGVEDGPKWSVNKNIRGFGVSVLQQKASDWFEPLSPASSTLGGRLA